LAEAIRAIAAEPVRPPGHTTSRTYGPRRSSAGTTRSAKKGSAGCGPEAASAALRWASTTRGESCCGRSARTTPRRAPRRSCDQVDVVSQSLPLRPARPTVSGALPRRAVRPVSWQSRGIPPPAGAADRPPAVCQILLVRETIRDSSDRMRSARRRCSGWKGCPS